MSEHREQWGSRAGFVLAAVGSAVGLGNMWRFSYVTAEHGGAAFVLLYVLMTLVLGLPVLLAELALGRGARKSPIGALRHFGGRRWLPLGWLFVLGAFLILSYYGVIAGWTARLAVEAVVFGFAPQAAEHFQAMASGWGAAGWHGLFMAGCVGVVFGGVKRGIERVSLVLMPLLFALVVGLAVYAATLPGAAAGYRYYLQPDFGALWSFDVISDAAGQAFFSLSLAMGAMLTFASYLDEGVHLPRESAVIAAADFGVALVAGLVVFPLVFALKLQAAVSESTLGALFITLPQAFAQMAGPGRAVGALFFTALLVGALTSAVSLLEVAVASVIDGLGWSRPRATLAVGGGAASCGVGAALDLRVLDWMDRLVGNVMLLIGALGLSVFVGWVLDNPVAVANQNARGETADHHPRASPRLRAGGRAWRVWRWLLRWLVPAMLSGMLLHTLAGWW